MLVCFRSSDCTWNIESTSGPISLEVMFTDVETSTNCAFDALEVYDGKLLLLNCFYKIYLCLVRWKDIQINKLYCINTVEKCTNIFGNFLSSTYNVHIQSYYMSDVHFWVLC